ncbi:MAG: hypothetical protein R2780_01620 [Crocinitomicaceae bacterium]|nr:hypothetical protein [Crocinitomicaceae bacterium]
MQGKLKLIKKNIGSIGELEEITYFEQFDGIDLLELNDNVIRLNHNGITEYQLTLFNQDAISKEFYGTLESGKRFRLVLPGESAIKIMESNGSPPVLSLGSMHQNGYAVHFEIISTGTDESLNPQEIYNLAVQSLQNEKINDAIKYADDLKRILPNNDAVYHLRAAIMMHIEDYEKCIIESRKCVELNPENGEGWNHLGVALSSLGKIEEGINAFQKGIALDHEACKMNYNYWINQL